MRLVSMTVEPMPNMSSRTPPAMAIGRPIPPVGTKFSWYGTQIAYRVMSLSCRAIRDPSVYTVPWSFGWVFQCLNRYRPSCLNDLDVSPGMVASEYCQPVVFGCEPVPPFAL